VTGNPRYSGSTEDMHPFELEARLGLLKCPNCGSRSVGVKVHNKGMGSKKEWGCTGCGAYSTNRTYSGDKHSFIDMEKAIQVVREGVRQQPSQAQRTDIEKIHSKAQEAHEQ
jgi:transposase-like protein